MPTTPNMSMVLPTDHSDSDIWGDILNTALTLNDLHDHTTGKGVPVPSAALKINADVAWSFAGTNYAITAMKALDFTPVAASSVSSYSSALFSNSTDANNLYYRNSAGTNVKITDGSTLNISIVGGIGGDYTSIGALVDYDDASDTYRFRQQTSASVRQFAKMKNADILLVEYDAAGDASVPANFVTMKSPDALAASYDWIFAGALPGAQNIVQISAAGQLIYSNTLTQSVTAPDYKLSADQTKTVNGAVFFGLAASTMFTTATHWLHGTSTTHIFIPLDLDVGDRIKSWTVYLSKTSASGTIFADLWENDGPAGTTTRIGSQQSNGANNPGAITLGQSGLTTTVASGKSYFIEITPSGTNGDLTKQAQFTYDRP